MSDQRSSSQIEDDIERERSELGATLNELSDRFSPDHLVREAGTALRDHGGEISRAVSRSVKENPLALAVTGVGLAWLIFGQGRDTGGSAARLPAPSATTRDPVPRDDLRDGQPGTPVAVADRNRTFFHDDPEWMRPDPEEFDDHDDHYDHDDMAFGRDPGRDDDGPSATDRARAGLSSAGASLSSSADRARSGAQRRADAARMRARRMRDRLSRGTEDMTEASRRRVIAARERAVEARDAAARNARMGMDRAQDFYDQQPLVVGALALAVGAALGGGLPRSRTEDRHLGQYSDHLMNEAERVFREEAGKAKSVAQSVGEEVRDLAEEKRAKVDDQAPGDRSATEQVRHEMEDAAQRIKDRAEDEADRKDLGSPRT